MARDLCAFAKEAGLRAACEQIAVELRPPEEDTPVGETEDSGGQATKAADIRIEAEAGKPVTWIDVAAHCDMAACRSNPIPRKPATAATSGEKAKFSLWGMNRPSANPHRGKAYSSSLWIARPYGTALGTGTPEMVTDLRQAACTGHRIQHCHCTDCRLTAMAAKAEHFASAGQCGNSPRGPRLPASSGVPRGARRLAAQVGAVPW